MSVSPLPLSTTTCQHCGKSIKRKTFIVPPDVTTTKDGKKYRVVREHQLAKPIHRENQTERIPVYYIQEMGKS